MIPKMPETYKAPVFIGCGYTKTKPRAWTEKEIEWLKSMLSEGYSLSEIAISMDRSETSIAIKRKRLTKKNISYNKHHITEKYLANESCLRIVQPETVLDLYCGAESYYRKRGYNTITNDLDENIEADYHMDAFKLICLLYSQGKKFDFIDLDPFGSAYDCFDLAIKMATKGIAITLGEIGHKRWKRLDYVKNRYGIESLENFTIENLIKHIQTIGFRNKKMLEVIEYQEWQNIGRVWFKILPLKITEQWEKDKPKQPTVVSKKEVFGGSHQLTLVEYMQSKESNT